jgi:hypothetical protein
MYDDYYLLRFLRARKFDHEKTKLMFVNFVAWRKENDVDNVIEVTYFFCLNNFFFLALLIRRTYLSSRILPSLLPQG